MKFFKKLFQFYIFSNLHVALAGFSLTRITEIRFEIDNYFASLFVAFSIVLSYNFIRYFEVKTARLVWFYSWFNTNFRKIKLLFGLSILGLCLLIFKGFINFNAILFVLPFGFMTFFYAVPLFKIGKTDVSFRNLPFIKIFSISIAWAGVTVFFPLVNFGLEIDLNTFLVFLINFFFVFAITIPFDIRDVYNDADKLKTIPQIFGVNGAKIIGVLSIVLLIFTSYFWENQIGTDIIFISIIATIFMLFSSSNQNRFYSSFWVESIPIMWFLIIVYF